jgi:hypothetical protein
VLVNGGGTKPEDFLYHSEYLYQVAKRYGPTAGTGAVDAIESWNEPDGYWKDNGFFSKQQIYNMLVANYDGHNKTMPTSGIKPADSAVKHSLGGFVSLDLSNPYGILEHMVTDNNTNFPSDIISVHEYASTGNNTTDTAMTPESFGLRQHMERLARWRDTYAPGKEIWQTEFGYDTYRTSNSASRTYAGLQNQANWLLRSYILYRAGGADKAFAFIYRDDALNKPGLFESSGIVDANNAKRPAYYYIATMQDEIGSMYLDRQIETNNSDVLNFAFQDPTSNAGAFVVWKTTGTGATIPGFTLQLPSNTIGTCTAKVPSKNSFTPTATQLTVNSNHQVTVTVSETPTFIECSDVTGDVQEVIPTYTAPAADTTGRITLTGDDVFGVGEKLDDPETYHKRLAVLFNDAKANTDITSIKPTTYFEPNLGVQDVFAVDLHGSFNLNAIKAYNANNGGNKAYSVYYAKAGEYGKWQSLTSLNPGTPGAWNSTSINVTAQYLKFVPLGTLSFGIGELAVFGTQASASPSPTLSTTPTINPSPTIPFTPTPTLKPTIIPTAIPGAISSPTPTLTLTPTPKPTNTPTPRPTATPAPTVTKAPTSAPTPTPTPSASGKSVITIYAQGKADTVLPPDQPTLPQMQLLINDKVVKTWWDVSATAQAYSFTYTSAVSPNMVKVKYVNDFNTDRALKVDKITIDGVDYQSEDPKTFSQGGRTGTRTCSSGNLQTEWLECNGYFWYTR